jgi:hypothetical protein
MITISETIPRGKMAQFHSILKQTGGRYVSNPCFYAESVRVSYIAGDYERHKEMWARVTIRIVEFDRRNVLRRMLNRARVMIKNGKAKLVGRTGKCFMGKVAFKLENKPRLDSY